MGRELPSGREIWKAGFIGQNRAADIKESIAPLFSEQGARLARHVGGFGRTG
jgi:hypothetical protein